MVVASPPAKNPPLLVSMPEVKRTALNTLVLVVLFHLVYVVIPLGLLILPPLSTYRILKSLQQQQQACMFDSVVSSIGAIYYVWFASSMGFADRGKPWKAVENMPLINFILGSIPVRLLRTAPLSTSKGEKYIFSLHPHGAIAFNRASIGFSTSLLWDKVFPEIKRFRVLTASAAFAVPLIRELWLASYCIHASKECAVKAMRAGASLVLYPGGEAEQLLTIRGRERLFLKERKGFVKLALEEGAQLVPCYAFGESDLYEHSQLGISTRKMWAKYFKVAVPLVYGKWGMCPYRDAPITMVFGEPLKFDKLAKASEVSDEELNRAHAKYVEAIKKLFETHKAEMGFPERELEIF